MVRAGVAQGRRFLGKEKVTGSNPVIGSVNKTENKPIKPWQRRILSVRSRT